MPSIGAVLFEQNDDWQTSSCDLIAGAFAQIKKEEIGPILSITTKVAGSGPRVIREIPQLDGHDRRKVTRRDGV